VADQPRETEEAPQTQDRWLVVLAAIILNLALGALYSWPVFANFLETSLSEAQNWTAVETQLVFSMATVFLAVGVIAAGHISERREPRTLLVISAACTGGGYLLGGALPLYPVIVIITIGVIVGFGIGMAYALPIILAARWFPDRKGLVTGLAMAGFGVGSVLWSQTFDLLLANAIGIRLSFIAFGIVFGALILLTSKFLYYPPPRYRETLDRRPKSRLDRILARTPRPRERSQPQAKGPDFTRKEILARPQLYFLFYTFVVGSAIGLLVIGMSKTYPIERLVAAGYSRRLAANVTRLGALILFPVFNGFGRVVFGWLSDHLGWKPVMVSSYVLQAVLLVAFPWLMGMPVAVVIVLPLLAMCYGGNFTIFPLATGHLWGSDHLAANYSLVFLAFGVGALVGPSLGGLARDAEILKVTFVIAGGLLALGAILVALIRKPVRDIARDPQGSAQAQN
jgi:OFA family oxalate/formate antiporter-like MFS transporter